MKKSDIIIGETYGYAYGTNPGLHSLRPFKVTGFCAARRGTQNNVSGLFLNQETLEVQTASDAPSRRLHMLWSEVQERREKARVAADAAEVEKLRRYNERDPKIARLEAALRKAGVEPRSRYEGIYYLDDEGRAFPRHFEDHTGGENVVIETVLDRNAVIRYDRVELQLDDLIALLDALGA